MELADGHISVTMLRALLVVGGIVLMLVAWNTSDTFWSVSYWREKLFDDEIRIFGDERSQQQEGGMARLMTLLLSVGLVLLGLFGEPLLRHVADNFTFSRRP